MKLAPNEAPFNFIVFGDLGVENGVSTPYLIREAKDNLYDFMCLIGDFAYDMSDVCKQ